METGPGALRGAAAVVVLAIAVAFAAAGVGDERERAARTREVLAALEEASDEAYRALRAAFEAARAWPPRGGPGELWRLVEQIEADVDRLEARYRDDDDVSDATSAVGRLARRFEALGWLAPRAPADDRARAAVAALRERGGELVALWRDVLDREQEDRREILPRRTLSRGEADALRDGLVALGVAVGPLQELVPEFAASEAPVEDSAGEGGVATQPGDTEPPTNAAAEPGGERPPAPVEAGSAESGDQRGGDSQGAIENNGGGDGRGEGDDGGQARRDVVITMREAKLVRPDDPSIATEPGDDSWRDRRVADLEAEIGWFCAIARDAARDAADPAVHIDAIEARLGLLLRTARAVDQALARAEQSADRELAFRWSEARRALSLAARATGVTLESP